MVPPSASENTPTPSYLPSQELSAPLPCRTSLGICSPPIHPSKVISKNISGTSRSTHKQLDWPPCPFCTQKSEGTFLTALLIWPWSSSSVLEGISESGDPNKNKTYQVCEKKLYCRVRSLSYYSILDEFIFNDFRFFPIFWLFRMASGILVTQPGIKLTPWKPGVLTTGLPGSYVSTVLLKGRDTSWTTCQDTFSTIQFPQLLRWGAVNGKDFPGGPMV